MRPSRRPTGPAPPTSSSGPWKPLLRARSSEFGTEIHLVSRLAAEHPDKRIVSLDPMVCPCSTMFRIDSAHLAWILEGLVEGRVQNRITVDGETARWARVALDRMLSIT